MLCHTLSFSDSTFWYKPMKYYHARHYAMIKFHFFPHQLQCPIVIKLSYKWSSWVWALNMEYTIIHFYMEWFQKLLLRFSVYYIHTICRSICKKPTMTYFGNRKAQWILAREFAKMELCTPFSDTLIFRTSNLTIVFIF